MYVRKFEAESMDEALQAIKQELGPDAIILKTTTNKGLRGAFKKNRIEITAAISEKNYSSKSKVDHILDENQKEKFYQSSPSQMSEAINGNNQQTPSNYGKAGLNRQVQSVKDFGDKVKTGLDDFLSSGAGEFTSPQNSLRNFDDFIGSPIIENKVSPHYEMKSEKTPIVEAEIKVGGSSSQKDALIDLQRKKIDELEKKIFEIARSVERLDKKEPTGIYQLRTTLRSLGITEHFIQDIGKKAIFELSEEETQDPDIVFEFALREMLNVVQVEMPMFSELNESDTPVVTVLVSDSSCGQSKNIYKLAALKSDSVVIRSSKEEKTTFTDKMFNLNIIYVDSIAEFISETRKATETGKNVFIDYKNLNNELNETKKFVDGLKRAFGKVEVLVCLSAIHTEIYNRKVLSRYHSLSDGMIISHLDLCLNYGNVFNIAEEYSDLPLKFFGTGETIPEDIEAATAERVLAGMFHLN